VKNGQALTSSLLSFARREVLQTSRASLNQIIAGTREMIRLTIGSKIELRIETDPDLWPVFVSEQQIELAVINLAINSRDAMPDGGVLTITGCNIDLTGTEKGGLQGRFVLLRIVDTGTGMAPEVLARATEPFYTTKSAGKGTGLGLNMVRTTIESMGGILRIDSIEGCGTTVSIYLATTESVAAPAYHPTELVNEA
jgi:signal transduction histidine kinase